MRILSCCLIILALAACAGPSVQPEPQRAPAAEAERSVPSPPAEAAETVEPVAVIEVREEPDTDTPPTAMVVNDASQDEPAIGVNGADESPAADGPAAEPPSPEPAPAAGPSPSLSEPPAPAAERVNLSGQVTILRNGREQPFAGLHLNQTVIAWRPDGPATVEAMTEQQIMTRRSRFFPQTMAVTSGTSVRFPNMDSINHNVFSLTPRHQFDVGLYGEGDGRSHVFTGSGMVELYCNVHPNMAAFVLVLDTPHFVNPDEEGRFTLLDLPAGPGELLIWNYRAEEIFQRRPMQLSAVSEPLNIRLDISRPSVPQHTNKHGETYNRDRARP